MTQKRPTIHRKHRRPCEHLKTKTRSKMLGFGKVRRSIVCSLCKKLMQYA